MGRNIPTPEDKNSGDMDEVRFDPVYCRHCHTPLPSAELSFLGYCKSCSKEESNQPNVKHEVCAFGIKIPARIFWPIVTPCLIWYVVFIILTSTEKDIIDPSDYEPNPQYKGTSESSSSNRHPRFKNLCGYCSPNVDVYTSASGQNPPVYVFTIIDPIVDMDGDRYMLVRLPSGSTEYKLRKAFVYSSLYYVKDEVP